MTSTKIISGAHCDTGHMAALRTLNQIRSQNEKHALTSVKTRENM